MPSGEFSAISARGIVSGIDKAVLNLRPQGKNLDGQLQMKLHKCLKISRVLEK